MNTLSNGKLLVRGEMDDIFEVVICEVRADMIIEVKLLPNSHSLENGVTEVEVSFDPLNENLIDLLKSEGYSVITESQVPLIQI